jgi:hypothetical protein
MGGWVDGWVDGWVGGWMGGWMDGWVDGWVGGWMDIWVGECMHGETEMVPGKVFLCFAQTLFKKITHF